MLIEFDEEFDLPVDDVYQYFKAPGDWPRLYGSFGEVEDRGQGWHAVPLQHFPFPLLVRVTRLEPGSCVRWEFRGFWQGEGEVRFAPTARGVAVRGYERISVRPLPWLAPVLERLFLESKFRKVWESGWRRLRRLASSRAEAAPRQPVS